MSPPEITSPAREQMSIDRRPARTWLIGLVALISIAAAAAAVIALRNLRAASSAAPPTLRLALVSPDNVSVGGGPDYPFGLALGPDGRRLVFPAAKAGQVQLWMRDLTTGETQALPGTDEGVLPFWAPDGRAIGFFAGGRLRIITLEDAAVRDLAEAPSPRGGAWHPAGDIVFAPGSDGGLYRRRGATGAIEPFTSLDAAAGELSHRLPTFVDAGRHLIFFVGASQSNRQGIWLAPLDAPQNRRRLTGGDTQALAIADAILYSSDGALLAQRLDVEAQTLTGRSVLIGTPVGVGPHNQLFATAAGDTIIYGAAASTLRELRWFDRAGTITGAVGEPMDAWDVRISPNGSSVAVARADPQLGTLDIWAYDGGRPLPRRVSSAIDADETPVWARDGHRLAWVTGRRTVTLRGALATLPEQTVLKFEHTVRISDWSPDQQWIVGSESRPGTHDDLWLLPSTPPAAPGAPVPYPYAQTPFNETQGVVSPDGRWIAYASDESGRFEIYMDSFPKPATRARLTTGGGLDPRWRGDSAELYFRRGTEIHAVNPIGATGTPEAVSSERLFDAGKEIRAYDVAADGLQFLLNVPAAEGAPPPMTVLVNARSLLRFAP
jgi:eukaryotic-like serine/threonine-protein kinase